MIQETTPPKEMKKYYDHISVAKRTSNKVYFVAQHDKNGMLDLVLKDMGTKQIIIIAKSKKVADELYFYLKESGHKVLAAHGNHKPEIVKERIETFNKTEINILITTDMILQANELENIGVILNYDLPFKPENYFKSMRLVDEIGECISFVSADEEKILALIELMLKMEVPEAIMDGFEPTPFSKTYKEKKKKPRHKKKSQKKDIITKS